MLAVRSLLFAPANRPDLLRKFARYRADAFAIDLEDGTPPTEKATARSALSTSVAGLREAGVAGLLFVRTNQPSSPHHEADLSAALATAIDGVILPKLETPAELQRVEEALTAAQAQADRRLHLIALIETAAGVLKVDALAHAGVRLSALAFGAEDFITDMGGVRTDEGMEVLYARSRVVLAARAAGLSALDQVFTHVRDDEGCARDAQMGRQLGYAGKLCIHPRQVDIVHGVFSPSAEEVARSRRLIDACEAARAAGRGTIEFEGGMVDEPMLTRARNLLALASRLDLPS